MKPLPTISYQRVKTLQSVRYCDLVGLEMPEAYGFTGFRREHLPILPTEFKLVPLQIRDGKEWKNDPGVMKQLKVIKGLFDRADGIIVATDAGRDYQK